MSWSPYGFSNLQLREIRSNAGRWTWGGFGERWEGDDTSCELYTSGIVTGSVHCTIAGGPPQTDNQTVPAPTGEADFASVAISFAPPAYNGGADPADPCYHVGQHPVGLNSGGCRPLNIIAPQTELRNSGGYPDLIDIDGTAHTATFVPGDEGGSFFIVNPSPITYPGMDPGNEANQTLFNVADLPAAIWFRFPAMPLSVVRVGSASGITDGINVRYFSPIVPGDLPVGTITPGPPISGVIRRKVHT